MYQPTLEIQKQLPKQHIDHGIIQEIQILESWRKIQQQRKAASEVLISWRAMEGIAKVRKSTEMPLVSRRNLSKDLDLY